MFFVVDEDYPDAGAIGPEYALYTLPITRKFQKRQQQLHSHQHADKFTSLKRRTPAELREERARQAAASRRHSQILVEELAAGQQTTEQQETDQQTAGQRSAGQQTAVTQAAGQMAAEQLTTCQQAAAWQRLREKKHKESGKKDGQAKEKTKTNQERGNEALYASLERRPAARTPSSLRQREDSKAERKAKDMEALQEMARAKIRMEEDFQSVVVIEQGSLLLPAEESSGLENSYQSEEEEDQEEEVDSEGKTMKKRIYGGRDGFNILSVEVRPLERDEQRQQY